MAFQIIRDDITRVVADAIVNTANPKPIDGGGTDHAVYQAAGREQLLRARQAIGPIARGQAAATPAFRLQAKYIIHTVGPVWYGGDRGEFEILRSCYENSLALAKKLGCQSIAFPLIATGVYGFPKDQALKIAMSVIQDFLMEQPEMRVILVVFDKRAFELSGTVVDHVRQFVDANYVEEAHRREYAIDRFRSRFYSTFHRNRQEEPERHSATDSHGFWSRPGNTSAQKPLENQPDGKGLGMGWPEEEAGADTALYAARSTCFQSRRTEASLSASDLDLEYLEEMEESCAPGLGTSRSQAPIPKAPMPKATISEAPMSQAALPQVSCSRASRSQAPQPQAAPGQIPAGRAAVSGKKVDIDALLAASQKTFQERLFEIIDERGLTGPQVYKNYISKQVYSKLQADRDYHPNKFTAIALCLSLHLSIEETRDLIGRAGWALSPSNKADLVVTGCILNGIYNLVQINILLFDYDCPELERIR